MLSCCVCVCNVLLLKISWCVHCKAVCHMLGVELVCLCVKCIVFVCLCAQCTVAQVKMVCANVAIICQRRRPSQSIMRGQLIQVVSSSSSPSSSTSSPPSSSSSQQSASEKGHVYEFQDTIQVILFVKFQSASDRSGVFLLTDLWRVANVATVTTHFQLKKAREETADRKAGDEDMY